MRRLVSCLAACSIATLTVGQVLALSPVKPTNLPSLTAEKAIVIARAYAKDHKINVEDKYISSVMLKSREVFLDSKPKWQHEWEISWSSSPLFVAHVILRVRDTGTVKAERTSLQDLSNKRNGGDG